jgi:hypothetical protein
MNAMNCSFFVIKFSVFHHLGPMGWTFAVHVNKFWSWCRRLLLAIAAKRDLYFHKSETVLSFGHLVMSMEGYKIIGPIIRTAQERRAKAYQEWLGRLVTLSGGGLTLLVSLQSIYVPHNPTGIWLLHGCWGCLGLAVLSGLLALYGEVQLHDEYRLRIVKRLEESHIPILQMNAPEAQKIIADIRYEYRSIFVVAMRGCVFSFVLSIVLLTWFAELNLQSVLR